MQARHAGKSEEPEPDERDELELETGKAPSLGRGMNVDGTKEPGAVGEGEDRAGEEGGLR